MGSLMSSQKANRIGTGITAGILLPLMLLIIIFAIKKNDYGFFEYIRLNLQIGNLPKVISLSLIPNLALFFLFIQKNYLKSARGIIMAMFIAGFIIVILKLV
ncbi:MAG: hypothetical protein K9H49_07880 [Bacteroidales bacterium]|nr:hypothetical protein [Bacteroidales bacterium]MCF8390147.1 hypothetical protein [Bacteroidales bacterium]